MLRTLSVFAAILLCTSLHAQTVYKCRTDGKTGYSDRPCAQGASTRMPPPPAGISAADTLGPQGGDARTLLELEKMRVDRKMRQKRETEAARDERAQQRLARASQARRQKCDRLRLRHKWAEEDLARTIHGPAHDAARLKARRQAETLAVECRG
jgi:hypothetical protein